MAKRRLPSPFPKGAILIRGGYNSRTQLRKQARRHKETYGTLTISVFASPSDETVEELAEIAGFGYPVMRVSTVKAVEAAGFRVVPHGRYGHGQVTFEDMTNATLDRFRAAFGRLVENPAVDEETS